MKFGSALLLSKSGQVTHHDFQYLTTANHGKALNSCLNLAKNHKHNPITPEIIRESIENRNLQPILADLRLSPLSLGLITACLISVFIIQIFQAVDSRPT